MSPFTFCTSASVTGCGSAVPPSIVTRHTPSASFTQTDWNVPARKRCLASALVNSIQ